MQSIRDFDPTIHSLIKQEEQRQNDKIRLIASENYVSQAILEATGSVLTNKYSEGYVGKRYYEGQQLIDQIEQLAIERAKELFGAEHVNVQPYSGSPANLAVFLAFVFVLIAQFTGGSVAVILVLLLSLLQTEVSFDDPDSILEAVLPNTALEQAIFLILAFGPIFLILWGWLALFEKRPFWTIGLERLGLWKKYLRGILVGLLMFVASIGISAAFGFIAFEDGDPQKQGVVALGGVILVFLGWMVQGAAEEALTRGWLFPVVGARYSVMLGLIVS